MGSRVTRFGLGGLRAFAGAEFVPGSGVSWFAGSNGAGKTTIVEAAYVLGHGRSFRAAQLEALHRTGQESFWVSATVEGADGLARVLGVRRYLGGVWDLRRDGAQVYRLSDLAREFPVLCFEPGSHQWVLGPSERRRKLLDWGAFHVEHAAPDLWTGYQRALRQRNAALRSGDRQSAAAWEPALSEFGEQISECRKRFHASWSSASLALLQEWSPELGALELSFRKGWGEQHESLLTALVAHRDRDLGLGYTYSGPHRADVLLRSRGVDARDRLSRGQGKMLALALLLGMSECFRERHGSPPLLLLDDLCSELDSAHAGSVLEWLRVSGGQVWITGVERPAWAAADREPLFHVEQGQVTPLI